MAQLGARLNGIQKVKGSNPFSSTKIKARRKDGLFRFSERSSGTLSLEANLVTQPIPHSVFPVPSSEDLARAQLKGVLEVLKAEAHLQDYRFRDPLEVCSLPTMAVKLLSNGTDLERRINLYALVGTAMQDMGFFVDMDIETERVYFDVQ